MAKNLGSGAKPRKRAKKISAGDISRIFAGIVFISGSVALIKKAAGVFTREPVSVIVLVLSVLLSLLFAGIGFAGICCPRKRPASDDWRVFPGICFSQKG